MKKIIKNYVFIVLTLLFTILLFKNNDLFKNCILNGCILFFKTVFPSLFPMFIINDILINYNFITILDYINTIFFQKIFKMPSTAFYVFILSIFSGTPTNAYITSNLVKEKYLEPKDAGIILSYSSFLNPLFLYNMLHTIFFDTQIVIKLIIINYGLNFFFAFIFRKYPYKKVPIQKVKEASFSSILSKSIERAFKTLTSILGTIIFYLLLCEMLNIFIKNPLINCAINGLLETTGGLSKLSTLSINYSLKIVLVSLFISFNGFSIHTQIKNIISDVHIPYNFFFVIRILHAFLSTTICLIIT